MGVIGYSAGGETALILAGAQPDVQRLHTYCQAQPQDADACRTQGVLIADRADLTAHADTRVRAVMLMAPLGLLFGRHALAPVQVPVLIYTGDRDQLLSLADNADALQRKLPVSPSYKVLAGAGHFVFMAPCNAEQQHRTPVLCRDADGVDRRHIHRSLRSQTAAFFGEAMAGDSAVPEPERAKSDRH